MTFKAISFAVRFIERIKDQQIFRPRQNVEQRGGLISDGIKPTCITVRCIKK
jgi:hypothetical protein